MASCGPDHWVLDVGAGRDRTGIDAALLPHVGHLVGVDPSEDIFLNSSLHQRHHVSLEGFARQTNQQFDVIFCTMVLEHVTDPDVFLTACRSLLKPSGTFLAVTSNVLHYFGLTTKLTSALRVNEWLLDRLIGKQYKASYHFPTVYRLNSVHAIQRSLNRAGFASVEFSCFDNWTEFCYVLPEGLHWAARLYSGLVYRLHAPLLMGRLLFRAIVP
jgi:SAM-dependent methyltransferase